MDSRPRRRFPTMLLGMLVGAAMLSPAWAGSAPATKAYVKKQVKKLSARIEDRYTKSEADARFQRRCQDGAVLAFATLSDPNSMPQDGTFYPVPGFNCAGGSVEMRDLFTPERFEVRFTGLGLTDPNPDLVVMVNSPTGTLASAAPGAGPDVLTVYTDDAGTLVEAPFSITVLHA